MNNIIELAKNLENIMWEAANKLTIYYLIQ